MAVTIHTPVEGFTGVVVGVAFAEGTAEVDDLTPEQRRYFRQHGYGIDRPAPPVEVPEPADPRLIGDDGDGIEALGTRLRDAAVDPQPGDFLAPTNAGSANPHGRLVVSPEIHGSQGVRPVRGGPVAPGAAQEAAETAHAAEHTSVPADSSESEPADDEEPTPAERPKVRDSINDWRSWVLSQGGDPDWVAEANKDDLQAWQPSQAQTEEN